MFGDVAFAQSPFASLGGNVYSVSLSEAVALSDVTSTDIIWGGNIAESVTATSSYVSRADFAAAIAESIVASAVFDTAGNVFNVSLSDSVTASAVSSSQVDFAAAIAEVTAASDSQTSTADFVAAVAESVSILDVLVGGYSINVQVVEAVTGSDSRSVTAIFAGTVSELIHAVAYSSAIKEVNARPDGIQLLVSVGNVLVWSVVDDSQNANWQNIDNEQTSGWTQIPS